MTSGKPGVKDPASNGMGNATLRWIVQTLVFVILFGSSLFISAGKWNWTMAWAYLGIFLLSQIIVGFFLLPLNPELVVERTQLEASREAQWDRPLVGIVSVFGPLALLIVAGLDQRWGWTPLLPERIQFSALAIAALGSTLTIWAMASNRFFYGHVRVEEERGHTVARTGPYQSVRHPGYVGAIIFNLAAPLLLGSLWAFVPAGVVVLVLILRTAFEDRFLMKLLPGYEEYAHQVPFRLIPGIW